MQFQRAARRAACAATIASVVVLTGASLAVRSHAQDGRSAFAAELAGYESKTTGTVLPENHDDMQNTRVRFEPGARTNWHSHAGGQVLVVQEGRGRMQQAGGPIREMAPGDAIFTQAGVAHWHGAAPEQSVVLLSFYIGKVTWQQPVNESEYLERSQR